MVMIPPATGHVNPICGLIHELCKNKNIEVLFYSDENYRELIEKTGATFRQNEKLTFSTVKPEDIVNRKGFGYMFRKLVDFAYDLLPQYLADVEKEKPDLILYDGLSITTKYLIEILKVRTANGKAKIQMPKTAEFAPNFPYSDVMLKKMRENNDEDIWSAFSLVGAFIKQFVFCWYYGISTYNPFKVFLSTNDKLVVVGVNPELQPDRDYFDHRFKFVGSCIAEDARIVDLKSDIELNELLTPFDRKPNNLKLIFISLGSMYNASFSVYD
jgi:UDP:flavonoid glycosyltransferase YjiC (YdhE family)